MGRAIDLFVTYRFLKLLTTPFEKTEAFKLGIIDENGNRIMQQGYQKTTSSSCHNSRKKRIHNSSQISIQYQKDICKGAWS